MYDLLTCPRHRIHKFISFIPFAIHTEESALNSDMDLSVKSVESFDYFKPGGKQFRNAALRNLPPRALTRDARSQRKQLECITALFTPGHCCQ